MVLNLIFSYSGQFFVPSVPAFCYLAVWLELLPVKTEGKKVFEYLSFLHIMGNQVLCSLQQRAHFFPFFPFITTVPIEAFLALDVTSQI